MSKLKPLTRSALALAISNALINPFAHAATIIVDSNSDSGAGVCTLREAIASANTSVSQTNGCYAGSASGTDTITFSNNLLSPNNTITLTGGALDVDGKDIEIDASVYGGSDGGITIDAGGNSGVFNVDASSLILNNLTITGGSATDGGGIFANNTSAISLNDSTVTGNFASSGGGGIYANSSSTISLSNSTVSDNTVTGSGYIYGGGIEARSSSSVILSNNSTVSGNSVEGGNYAGGGGVYAGNSNVDLTDSTVWGNTSGVQGGGILTRRTSGDSTLTLSNSEVLDNTAGKSGGGLLIRQTSSSIENSTISGNSATTGGGGAILTHADAEVNILNSRVSDNFSGNNGGGLDGSGSSITLTNSTVSGNSTSQDGGGIAMYRGDAHVILIDSTVSGNSANRDGGGIHAEETASATVINSTISGNSASEDGGGLFIYNRVLFSLSNSTVSGNSASNEGSGVYVGLFDLPSISTFTLNNSIIANSANGDDLFLHTGATVTTDASSIIEEASFGGSRTGDPGLLPLADNGAATQTHALSISSIARNTGGCDVENDQRGQVRDSSNGLCDVGAVEFASIEVTSNDDNGGGEACTLREAIVSINSQSLQGGCVVSDGSDLINLVSFASDLTSNTVTLSNGVLAIDPDRVVSIDASNIDGGITIDADNASRVFSTNSATLSIESMTITGGYSGYPRSGGGIQARYSSKITLSNSTVLGNAANINGGGINVVSASSLDLSNSTVSGNSSGFFGGGINAVQASVTAINSTVSGNFASSGGGGIYTSDGSVSLINSTLSGNLADFYGGGISTNISSVSLNNSTLSGNSAGAYGGGLSVRNSSSVSLSNSIIANTLNGDDVYLDSSTLISDSASIIEEASFGGSRTGDPGLLALANNGGATKTHALRSSSIARDEGVLTGAEEGFDNCTVIDQRGQLRDDGDGACDVGAIEYNANDDAGFFVIPLGNGKVAVIPL